MLGLFVKTSPVCDKITHAIPLLCDWLITCFQTLIKINLEAFFLLTLPKSLM